MESAWSSVLGRFELLIVHWSIQRFLVRQWVLCCQSTKAWVLFPLQRNAWSSVVHVLRQSTGFVEFQVFLREKVDYGS